MLLIISVLAAACLIAFTGSASAASVTAGDPIEGALVKLVDYPQYNDTTDVNGNYTINNVPYGTYTISASAAGYKTNTSTVTVDGAITKDFQLSNRTMLLQKSDKLYMPWVNESTEFRSNIQITNTEPTVASVNVSMYDTNGNLLANKSIEISPNAYIQKNQVVLWLGLVAPKEGYLYFESNASVVIAGQVIGNTNEDPAMMSAINLEMLGTDLALPAVVRGWNWKSNLFMMNPNSVPANVNLTEYYMNGTLLATKPVVIPAKGMLIKRDIVTFMGVESGLQTVGAFRAVSDVPIYVVAESKNTNNGQSGFVEAANLARTGITQYIPMVNDSIEYRSNIQIANFNSFDTTSNISMFDYNGTLLASKVVDLSPNEYYQANGMSTWLGLSYAEGYLRITSNNTGLIVAGQVIGNVTDDPAMMSAVVKEFGSSTAQAIPAVVRGWNWNSSVMVLNVNNVSANVDLTEYYMNGTVQATKPVVIPANGIMIQRDIVTAMGVESGIQTVGAFRIVSDVPIIATSEVMSTVLNRGFTYAVSVQ